MRVTAVAKNDDTSASPGTSGRGHITAALLVIGALWPWAFVGGATIQIAVLGAGIALLALRIITAPLVIPIPLFLITVGIVTLVIAQVVAGYGLTAQNYLIAALIGTLVASVGLGERLKPLLLTALIVSVALQLMETVTGSYIFTVSARDIQLNTELFTGATGLLRAKGIFYGPLTAAMFAVLVTVAYRGRRWVWMLGLVSAILAQGRLAIVLLVVGGIFFGPLRGWTWTRKIAAAAGAIVVLLIAWMLLDDLTRTNLLEAFDLTDRRNAARQAYWEMGWHLFAQGDLVTMLIGDPGATYREFGNSAENDYLQALNDVGFFGFGLLIALAIVLGRRARNAWLLLLIPAAFTAAPFAAVSTGTVLWAVMAMSGDQRAAIDPRAKESRTMRKRNRAERRSLLR